MYFQAGRDARKSGKQLMARVEHCDIIVIGGGSAAFEAAVAAREAGAERVVMLEKAPEAEYGGNARYSGTGFRFVHAGAEEIRQFVPDVDDALFKTLTIPPYGADDFMADLDRMTQGRMDPELAHTLVEEFECRGSLDAQHRHQLGAAEGARQGRRQALFRARHRHSRRRWRHRPARRSGARIAEGHRYRDPLRSRRSAPSTATCAVSRASRVSAADGRLRPRWPRR